MTRSGRRTERSGALFGLVIGLILAVPAPAAAATNQIEGFGVLAPAGVCDEPPDGFEDFTIVMTGSLVGCWYTDIVTTKENGSPSGIYQERGAEIFVGSLDGGPVGTFATTYFFNSKWDLSTGSEIHGRCLHPVVAGSGTGGFLGVSGRVDFKDEVATGRYLYRGHLSFK
jgi:hypothetical protein